MQLATCTAQTVHYVGSATHHDSDVVAVMQWEGPVHPQQVELAPQEGLQVVWMKGHHLGQVVHTPACGVLLCQQQDGVAVHGRGFYNLEKEGGDPEL